MPRACAPIDGRRRSDIIAVKTVRSDENVTLLQYENHER